MKYLAVWWWASALAAGDRYALNAFTIVKIAPAHGKNDLPKIWLLSDINSLVVTADSIIDNTLVKCSIKIQYPAEHSCKLAK